MSYCVVRCWCCTTPCTTLYDASYIPDASGPDALYDTVRRVVRSRRVGPRRLVRRPDASYNAFPTALINLALEGKSNVSWAKTIPVLVRIYVQRCAVQSFWNNLKGHSKGNHTLIVWRQRIHGRAAIT